MVKGRTFIVSGPSGVGKSTVLKALLERRSDLFFSVSATTRPARPGEIDGIHYRFLDVETFQEWIARDEFLEYAEFVGIFYVHHLIAYVVGSLDNVDKRMSGIAHFSILSGAGDQTKFISHSDKIVSLRIEKTEFLFVACQTAFVGIFDD